jgi:hypothetical protein
MNISMLIDQTRYEATDPRVEALARSFQEDGYVPFPGFLSPTGLEALRRELHALEKASQRRDFLMGCMGDSPRRMSTVGGQVICRVSRLLPEFYCSRPLMDLLAAVAGEEVVMVPDPIERHVANFLHRQGDTHGSHFDDYPFALVMFIETPSGPEEGGLLEFVPEARELEDLEGPDVRRAFHRPGDAYLLKSDTSAHRVTGLTAEARRTVLNFAYATPATAHIKTESAAALYG